MNEQSSTLSVHLLNEAKKFQFYPKKMYRTKTNLGAQEMLDGARHDFLEWRKTFIPADAPQASGKLNTPVFLDELYCRDLLGEIPSIVERTLRLRELTLAGISDDEAFVQLREAANCFIMGLPNAAVALSRAAFEGPLRTKTARTFGREAVSTADLKDVIDDLQREAECSQWKDEIEHTRFASPRTGFCTVSARNRLMRSTF